MSDYALFYNSINGDRVYDADDFTEWLNPFFTTGVFRDQFAVTSAGNMVISVDPGYTNIEGKVKRFIEATELTLDRAHSTLNRIDTIIVRRDDSERDITIMVQKGTNAETPIAPTPVRENGIYDLVLAQININAAATAITAQDIIDTRSDHDLCGWVDVGVDIPGNLQEQIDELKVSKLDKVLVVETPSYSTLPQTISNSDITSNMVVVKSVLSNPSAQTGDWTVTTNNGSLSISGSISGSTTLTLYLLEQR